jgi:hypothetical protein
VKNNSRTALCVYCTPNLTTWFFKYFPGISWDIIMHLIIWYWVPVNKFCYKPHPHLNKSETQNNSLQANLICLLEVINNICYWVTWQCTNIWLPVFPNFLGIYSVLIPNMVNFQCFHINLCIWKKQFGGLLVEGAFGCSTHEAIAF